MVMNIEFEDFVKKEMGDIAVFDDGRYISPKIQAYFKIWEASQNSVNRKSLDNVKFAYGAFESLYLKASEEYAATPKLMNACRTASWQLLKLKEAIP